MKNDFNHTNLFFWATSELSQDAFICWLLTHHSAYKDSDESRDRCLTEIAEDLLKELIGKVQEVQSFKDVEGLQNIRSLKIKKQYKSIDVLLVINDQYALIIEDKTDTSNHNNQLLRYYNKIKNEKNDGGKKIYKEVGIIYFKTGNECYRGEIKIKATDEVVEKLKLTLKLEDIEKDLKVPTFYRDDFLRILEKKESSNNIFLDYKKRLEYLEDQTNSYKTQIIKEWNQYALQGFLNYIVKGRNIDFSWRYVPNAQGGFIGCWYGSKNVKDYSLYLQVNFTFTKEDKLSKIDIHIRVSNEDQKLNKGDFATIDKALGFDIKKEDYNFKIKNNRRVGSSAAVYIYKEKKSNVAESKICFKQNYCDLEEFIMISVSDFNGVFPNK